MKKYVNRRIAIIGIAVLVFLTVANTVTAGGSSESGPSANDKEKADEFYKKGKESYDKRDYDQAITELTESIRLNPNYSNAYLYRSYAYQRKSEFDKAIADCDKAIQLSPNHWGFYNARGHVYVDIRDFDRALADYDKAIQLDPKRASLYNARAWLYAYHLKKEFNRAISDANEALNLDPNNESYLDTRGWAYLGNGDYDKAIADFERVLQINSNITSSKEGLAQARLSRIKPESVKDEDFEVKQNTDNTLTITGYKGTARNVVIPATLYGLKVTIIGNTAFYDKGLLSVVIPDTVTSIEHGYSYTYAFTEYVSGAFSDNPTLTKLTLGKGLKTIGLCAFKNTGLTEVIIPDSVTVIEDAAFSSSKLVKVTLGTGLQSIGIYAFSGNQITEVNLPSSVKEMKHSAFADNKIQKVTFGTGLEIINEGAFQRNQITELELPSSVKQIGTAAFADNKIQKVTFSTKLEIIGDAFRNNQIAEVNLPSSIKEIRGGFENNPLTTVVIPPSLANGRIGRGSFGNIEKSTISRITIPTGMKEDTIKGLFEDAFVNFWINQNKAGGTYVKRGPIWTKE